MACRNNNDSPFVVIELAMLGVLIGMIFVAAVMFWSRIFLSIIEERQMEEERQKRYVEYRTNLEKDIFTMKNKMEKENLRKSTEIIIGNTYKIERNGNNYKIFNIKNSNPMCENLKTDKFSTNGCAYNILEIHFN